MAFQSIKKILPDSCRCMEAPLIQKVARCFAGSPPALPEGYLQFVKNETSRLFPPGWDKSVYEDFAVTTVPPLSAAVGCPRSSGGVLGSDIDHSSYLDVVLGTQRSPYGEYVAELTVVQSAGKPRPLSRQPAEAFVLKPLHKSMYSRLSRKKWLLRGDVTADSLSQFSPHPEWSLVSGDYASATDGLSIEVAETIMRAVINNSVSVPNSVADYALRSLRPRLVNSRLGIDICATVGQQMGSYLSFPLLCIQNRIAFLFAARSFGVAGTTLPCLINGDDILFQAPARFYAHWVEVLSRVGLVVERSKTSVSTAYGSINSTLLRFRAKALLVVPTVRFGLLRLSEIGIELGESYNDFVSGLKGNLRYRAAALFFSRHVGTLRRLQLSTFELGFRGALAFRLTVKFGLLLGGDRKPPQALVEHSVTLPTGSVTWVREDSLDETARREAAAELAAWRFSVTWERAKSGKLGWLSGLSSIRPDQPCFRTLSFPRGSSLTRWPGSVVGDWLLPVPRKEKVVPLLSDVILNDSWFRSNDVLPGYDPAWEVTTVMRYAEIAVTPDGGWKAAGAFGPK